MGTTTPTATLPPWLRPALLLPEGSIGVGLDVEDDEAGSD